MAERRMFAKTIIDSDAFLEMPATSQLLYFHLSMRADDEGFVNSPKSIMRLIGSKDDDLKILAAKKFIIPFESGIVVIKHWKIHNYIRGDRLHDTKYSKERALLGLDENNSYTLCQSNVSQLVDNCHTEVRLGKVSIDKNNNNSAKNIAQNESEELWKLYPEKKGKAKAVKKIPQLIKKHSFEQMQRCIERYISYVESRRNTDFKDLKYQNGSTFFNGTYVDYLDENWKEEGHGATTDNQSSGTDTSREGIGITL